MRQFVLPSVVAGTIESNDLRKIGKDYVAS